MLAVYLIVSLFYISGQCQLLAPTNSVNDHKLIECLINVLEKYFTEEPELTFVSLSEQKEDEILKAIHSTMNFTLTSRTPSLNMYLYNAKYLVFAISVADFTKHFKYLTREPAWNPYARFLIVIQCLKDDELTVIFDEFLRLHVNNVVVVNGTDDAHLYTYNPFDNYACGKYYETVITYGLCAEATTNLYPNKLVTGLRNCTFTASLTHRPPFSIDPSRTQDEKKKMGTEEYILSLLSKIEQFTVTFKYNSYGEQYSTVIPNMTVIGHMVVLQNNECDIMFGAMMLVTARAEAFTYLHGYHDYTDELLFAVKSSPIVPTWKYIYLEFEPDVWGYIFICLIVYSAFVVILIHSKDWGKVVLWLLDNLLLHGHVIRTRLSVKCVLIMWMWFAYLINTFYQSNLFSLTTHPSLDYQIINEEDIFKYNLKPCLSNSVRKYMLSETIELGKRKNFNDDVCKTTVDAMDTVSTSDDVFTIVPNYFYLYNEAKYSDKWGNPLVDCLDMEPYAKLLFGYFFYKGFPIPQSLKLNTLRMRESGLADKSLQDHYYARKLKKIFHKKTFETRFLFPWCICVFGILIATVAFIIELLIKYANICTRTTFRM